VERRQKYRGDTCGLWHNRVLSPPPGASCLFVPLTLGLTPQAKNMPRLRRSNQGVTPEGLHGGSTSGANLFQVRGTCILHLVSRRVGKLNSLLLTLYCMNIASPYEKNRYLLEMASV